MPEPAQVNIEAIAQSITEHLRQAKRYGAGLKKQKAVLVVVGLVGSGLATLVAGVTAANGPVVGSGTPGWRLA